MMRTVGKWAIRLAVVATVASWVARVFGSARSRTDPARRTFIAGDTIAGDTWPPVPTNPATKR